MACAGTICRVNALCTDGAVPTATCSLLLWDRQVRIWNSGSGKRPARAVNPALLTNCSRPPAHQFLGSGPSVAFVISGQYLASAPSKAPSHSGTQYPGASGDLAGRQAKSEPLFADDCSPAGAMCRQPSSGPVGAPRQAGRDEAGLVGRHAPAGVHGVSVKNFVISCFSFSSEGLLMYIMCPASK